VSETFAELEARVDEQEDARTYRGRTTWTKRAVDITVADLGDSDLLALACRRSSGVFEHAAMPYTAELLRRCAKLLEVGVAE
jgi:hypothetical protein